MYASVYVECHPSWFMYMANEMDLHRRRCVAPLRALPLHPCHGDELPWNIIDVAMCVLHSAQAALQAPLPFHHGAAVILECGSCASILSTTALTPVLPVGSGTHALCAQAARGMLRMQGRLYYKGFVNVSELGDSVRTCHAAFRQVTGTVATH